MQHVGQQGLRNEQQQHHLSLQDLMVSGLVALRPQPAVIVAGPAAGTSRKDLEA